jgi:signal peptidase I
VAVGAACIAYGFVDRRFFGGGALLLAALWYYASIRWVDRHGQWSAMPSVSATRKIVVGSFMAIALVALAATMLFISRFRIPQNGMYPGLPAGSHIFAVKRPYSSESSVKRGDIVVFVRDENGQRYNYIWRVVALPGESVAASGESLSVNGQAVRRERLREADGKTIFREQIGEASYEVAFDDSPRHIPPDVSLTVPSGQFFVMGDNRYDARDSRYFGTIPFSSIIGRKL